MAAHLLMLGVSAVMSHSHMHWPHVCLPIVRCRTHWASSHPTLRTEPKLTLRSETSRVQADLCRLSEESKTREVILYTSIVYSIAFFSVVLRIAGKAVSKRLAWDDAMVVAALFLTAIPLGCVLDMAVKGFGKHLWKLEDGKLMSILRYGRSPTTLVQA